MKHVHLSKGTDLLRALILIQEDNSEEIKKQEVMTKRLGSKKRISEKDEEPAEEEPAEEEPAAEEPAAEEPATPAKKKSDKLPGAKRLEDAELEQGKLPSVKDIVQRVNFIRAGASLKDENVLGDIQTWVIQLTEPERLAVYTTLDALAQIVLARKSGSEAPTFDQPGNLNISGGSVENKVASTIKSAPVQNAPKQQSGAPVPITVGEGVIKKLKEIDVPVRSGKSVPFGSKAHVSDLEQRIEDLERIRSYQEQGSDSRHVMGLAVRALKNQLRAALRRGTTGNPRVQDVAHMVEKDK